MAPQRCLFSSLYKDHCSLPSSAEEGCLVAVYMGFVITTAEVNVALCVARQAWEGRLKYAACQTVSAALHLRIC